MVPGLSPSGIAARLNESKEVLKGLKFIFADKRLSLGPEGRGKEKIINYA